MCTSKNAFFYNAYPLFSKTYLSFFITTSTLSPPHITQETSTGASKCSESQILSTPYHDIYEVLPETSINDEGDKCMDKTYDFTTPWEMTDDKVQSALTEFMVWASLTRDMEMQKGNLICSEMIGCSCFASYYSQLTIHHAPSLHALCSPSYY